MRRSIVSSFLLVALLALTPAATGQLVSQSGGYQLAALSLDGGGGGTCSLAFSSWVAIGELSSGQLLSANFKATIGFLAGSDPKPKNSPIVFGVTPAFGPKPGGNVITISGLNFDKFGSGPSTNVLIGGNLAVTNVLSNTQLTATVPAGFSGPRPLQVTNPFGAYTNLTGYIYTPAITTSAIVPIGSNLTIRNYGQAGQTYDTYVSSSPWVAMTKFGQFLIGPVPLLELLPNYSYPGPDGVSTVVIAVPDDPVLQGLVVYFQTLSISNPSPLAGVLTNASTTAIQ